MLHRPMAQQAGSTSGFASTDPAMGRGAGLLLLPALLLLLLLVVLPDTALAKRNKGKKSKRGANFHTQRLENDPRNADAPGSVTADGIREDGADAAAEVRPPLFPPRSPPPLPGRRAGVGSSPPQ